MYVTSMVCLLAPLLMGCAVRTAHGRAVAPRVHVALDARPLQQVEASDDMLLMISCCEGRNEQSANELCQTRSTKHAGEADGNREENLEHLESTYGKLLQLSLPPAYSGSRSAPCAERSARSTSCGKRAA